MWPLDSRSSARSWASFGRDGGIGLLIATSMNNFNPDGVFAAMLIIAIVALTAEGLFGLAERRLLSWRPPTTTETVAV